MPSYKTLYTKSQARVEKLTDLVINSNEMNHSVIITGAVGSGKSLVAKAIARKLQEMGKTVAIKEEGLTSPPNIALADWAILIKTPSKNSIPQITFSSAETFCEFAHLLIGL